MILYKLKFVRPEQHYVEVELSFDLPENEQTLLYMPVWIPGSYMIREFSRHLDRFQVKNETGEKIHYEKISKNQWVFNSREAGKYQVSYRLYAFEMTVRTNHVDASHALINGAATFLAIQGKENRTHRIIISPYKSWNEISTSLKPTDHKWVRDAESYEILADSPIEIGNQEIISFSAGGIKHELAIAGQSNMDKEKTIRDLKSIIEQEVRLFDKEHPCQKYVFILHHTDRVYGGLEHLNSSVNMLPRWDYAPRNRYLKSISLLSHEYFHLWNVKRIKPAELTTFDYQKENYTRQLWAIEGITSYYDDYFVYLAGVSGESEYLKIVADNISGVVNTPGNGEQSLTESGFDTWIKFYRPHENSHNTQVSYYTKGATVVTALNLLILSETSGEKSLDDVMRTLYEKYLADPKDGYTEEELIQIFQQTAESDLSDFFKKYIYGTDWLDYNFYLMLAGLELVNEENEDFSFDWELNQQDGNYFVSKINAGSSAEEAGINVQDEIISINGYRFEKDWQNLVYGKKEGDSVELLISRRGEIKSFNPILKYSRLKNYTIRKIENPTEKQILIRNKWLKVN